MREFVQLLAPANEHFAAQPRHGPAWTHLAEITFCNSISSCPPNTTTTTPQPDEMTTITTDDVEANRTTEHARTARTTKATLSEMCPSCYSQSGTKNEMLCPSYSTSIAVTSVITAIVTALLATFIFVLLLCKCHQKITPAGAKIGTSPGGGEGQEYEEMEVGVAASDPTYMEVKGGGGEGVAFNVKPMQLHDSNNFVGCSYALCEAALLLSSVRNK